MPSTDLPAELVLKIFHFACEDQPQPFRAGLSLIRKDWVYAAREVLFQRIIITVRRTETKAPVPLTSFARHIKSLTFQVEDQQQADFADEDQPVDPGSVPFQAPDIFLELGKAAINVVRLHFKTSFETFVAFPVALFSSFPLANITDLTVEGFLAVNPGLMMRSCPNLVSLTFESVFFAMLRDPKRSSIPSRKITHYRLNVWDVGKWIQPVFTSLKDNLVSLTYGVTQVRRLEDALKIAGSRLERLELVQPLDNRGDSIPDPTAHLIPFICTTCPNLRSLSIDIFHFDWTNATSFFLDLPGTLEELSISYPHSDLVESMLASLHNTNWLPNLKALGIRYPTPPRFRAYVQTPIPEQLRAACGYRGVSLKLELYLLL